MIWVRHFCTLELWKSSQLASGGCRRTRASEEGTALMLAAHAGHLHIVKHLAGDKGVSAKAAKSDNEGGRCGLLKGSRVPEHVDEIGPMHTQITNQFVSPPCNR